MPLTTFVMSVHQAACPPQYAMASVKTDVIRNMWLMVASGGPTNATGHVAEEGGRCDPRMRSSDLERNAGRAITSDRGGGDPQSPLPGILSADDPALPDHLKAQVESLPREVDVGVPGSVAYFANPGKRSLPAFGELPT
jgi:hypothetical protein